MIFRRTTDPELIRAIATDPAIWPTIGDDLAGDPAKWKPVIHDGIWYVLVDLDEGTPAGMLIFFSENSITSQVHICWGHAFRGLAATALRQGFHWFWEQTTCRRITGSVPVWNGPAFLAAIGAGMEAFGVNQHSSLKFSRLHHQVLFGISKPAEKVA